MNTIKPILPALKEKKRYIVFEIISENNLRFQEVKETIDHALLRFLGEHGCAKAGAVIMKDWHNNRGIIRVNNKEVDLVKASLTLIKEVNNKKAILKTLSVSGIIKKARQNLS